MNWEPNIFAVEYMAREIMPMILKQRPDAELRIAGGPLIPRLERLRTSPGIKVYGFVEDIRSFLRDADLYMMPMPQGAGVKNKLAEAMAAGLPVVTNSRGAEALSREGRAIIVCADRPEVLATESVRLLNNATAREALSEAVRAYALGHFSWTEYSQAFWACLRPTPYEELQH
jgi:glycosyltransferase involved in cell wall biosynthesis